MRLIKFRAWIGDRYEYEIVAGCCRGYFHNAKAESTTAYWPNTPIEQFTGLFDKNGKEIYEGDIVRCFDNSGDRACEVAVDFYGFREMIWGRETEGRTKVEIIGNIHENSELLK